MAAVHSSALAADNFCPFRRTPPCSHTNNTGQTTSLSASRARARPNHYYTHNVASTGRRGGLSIIDEKWQMAGFGRQGRTWRGEGGDGGVKREGQGERT